MSEAGLIRNQIITLLTCAHRQLVEYVPEVIHAAHEARVPALVVQHGFIANPDSDPELTFADGAAVWSDVAARVLHPRTSGVVVPTVVVVPVVAVVARADSGPAPEAAAAASKPAEASTSAKTPASAPRLTRSL